MRRCATCRRVDFECAKTGGSSAFSKSSNAEYGRGDGVVFDGKFCVELAQLIGLQNGRQQRGAFGRSQGYGRWRRVGLHELAEAIQAAALVELLPRLLEVVGVLGGKQRVQTVFRGLGHVIALEGTGNVGSGRTGSAAALCLISLHP